MTWLLSLVHALLGAVAGFMGMAGIASLWVRWFRIPTGQSNAGYYVYFVAIAGGIIGAIVGFVASRAAVDGSDSHFVRGLGYTASAGAIALALVLAASWLLADHPPTIDGRRLLIEVELRTPPVTALVERAGFDPGITLWNKHRKAYGFNTDYGSTVRPDGDRRVVTTRVELGSSAATRGLYVGWSEGCQLFVELRLPGKPTKAQFEWSEWQDETVFSPSSGWEQPGVDLHFAVRYRVIFAPERPKPPTAAERATQESAEAARAEASQREALAAIPVGAPITQYLEFTQYQFPDAIKADAFRRMRESAHFAEEYSAVVLHVNSDTAAHWMRFAAEFPGDRAPVIEAVRLAGADLAARIDSLSRKRKQTEGGGDANYDALARFGGFFSAAFALRESGVGDFTPELRAILVAARTKQNIPGVRSDIVRMASYYLQQWAGDKPAPDDPPPK
ncbi:hypothetical protein [Gemmatimonas groenlandica]|uniref:Uncharacterized protein n=1 Tax=Gemmatimonas groenlandica TaxID=2732249 RepID=A0A6M4IRE1_9BACT|nr:hypothetical protein [Gemmatimonas groenlandica]QJR37484.1 hypothetical protein HKW67_19180 [Gemmatimonas groenlandica]